MKREELYSGWKHLRGVFLEGTGEKVREALLSWAEGAFEAVQILVLERKISLRAVERLAEDLRAGKRFSVQSEDGGYMRSARSASWYDSTSVFLGAFYRIGGTVRLRALVGRFPAWTDPYRLAYSTLTRGGTWTVVDPPADEALLARAIAFREKAPLIERIDLRRQNLEGLKGLLPPDLAGPLARAVMRRIDPQNLRVWEGVALYREGDTRWLIFDGKAHPLEGKAWEIARRILRKRKHPPLERARMAVLMARLGG